MKEPSDGTHSVQKYGFNVVADLIAIMLMIIILMRNDGALNNNNQLLIFSNPIKCHQTECLSETISEGRSYNNVNIEISDCFFTRLSTLMGSGGVIFIEEMPPPMGSETYSMNISSSMFFSCSCYNGNGGGAIYFRSQNSKMKMICANKCSCSTGQMGNGHFAYLYVSSFVQIELLSVSQCSNITTGRGPVTILKGNQAVANSNSSLNIAYYYSGLEIQEPVTFMSHHCTFSNNQAVENCVFFYYLMTSTDLNVSLANIVHNKCTSKGIVEVLNGWGALLIQYCVFHMNQNMLFSQSGSMLNIYHSFFSHDPMSIGIYIDNQANNNSLTEKPTYIFQFFSSHYCNADNHLSSPNPTNEPSPLETPVSTPFRSFDEFQRTYDSQCTNQWVKKRGMKSIFTFVLSLTFSII